MRKSHLEKKAVVLLSGGLDSATTLAIAHEQGFELHALSFAYGQRHEVELAAAARVAKAIGVQDHRVIRIDLGDFGGSALTADIPVPKGGTSESDDGKIPVTYVPARNTIFLSYALAWAEVLGTGDIFIGVNAVDYSGYPDCRMAYIEAFERMANLATRAAVTGEAVCRIHTPLIQLGKDEIIRKGVALGVDYSLTHSCYDPDKSGRACGACDSCLIRRRGFEKAGIQDPTLYVD